VTHSPHGALSVAPPDARKGHLGQSGELTPSRQRLTIAHTGDGVPIYGPAGIAWRMMTKV